MCALTMYISKKKKLKIELPYDPGIPSESEHYMKKMKTLIQKDNCTSKFTAASFSIAKIQKQPKWPSVDDQIRKLWHKYKMEYYAAIKNNKILPLATK